MVTIHYPFHPHHGQTLQAVRWPRRADGSVTVVDPVGAHLQIPAWMTEPQAARFERSQQATISPPALLVLAALVRCHLESHTPKS